MAGFAPIHGDESTEYVVPDKTRTFLEHPEVFYDDDRQQKLCKAILSGDLTAVEKVITDGASISAEGRHGVTPLFWAYLSRKYQLFEYLLAKGADPNVSVYVPSDLRPGEPSFKFGQGDSVLYMSSKNRMSEQWLRVTLRYAKPQQWTHPMGGDNVLHAFFEDRGGGAFQTPETLGLIIKSGVDLDLQGDDGYTPLSYAVRRRHYALASQLLKAGASPACYDPGDEQIIHHLAGEYQVRHQSADEYPAEQARWEASQEKKDWDALIKLLRQKGFKLTDALLDLERAEAGNRGAYMYQRRLRREDRFCCGSGRKLQDQLG
ncbi:MAG: ankyrin repeat domain-containing protein, partial [Planctomycetaceae bacterium]